jgi:HSP20 family molecular chaperone IbpA
MTSPAAIYQGGRKDTKQKEGERSYGTTLKPLTLENLFDRANAIFHAVSQRAYDIFENNGHSLGHDLDPWFQAEKELLLPVHLDVTESDDALDVKAETPGFNEKELEINVEPCRLVIRGKREAKQEEKKCNTVYSETVSATLKNGVLELHLPKALKARKARSIPVEPKAAA